VRKLRQVGVLERGKCPAVERINPVAVWVFHRKVEYTEEREGKGKERYFSFG
jgi:hypothetical protein